MAIFHQLPDSVFQLLAVFLSIIIEALPFVLLGSIVSGFIEVFLTPEKVQNFLPKNKVLAILFGTLVGFIFPSCECGIVPIITRFLEKKCLATRLFLSWQLPLLLIQSFSLRPIRPLGTLGTTCFYVSSGLS